MNLGKINLSAFFAAFAPAIETKVATQLLGTDRGHQALAQLGVTPTAVTQDQAKAFAQPLVDTALAAAKPQLEALIDQVVTDHVPVAYRTDAINAINAKIEGWTVKV